MHVTVSRAVGFMGAALLLLGAGAAWCQEPQPEPFTPMLPPGNQAQPPAPQPAPPARAPAAAASAPQPEPFTPVLPPQQATPPPPPAPHSNAWYSLPQKSAATTTQDAQSQQTSDTGLVSDIKAYVTSPLHWDRNDWAWFAAAAVAIGVSHHYDTQVRRHFTYNLTAQQIKDASTHDGKDAIPAAAVLLGTWAYASLIDDNNGRHESWDMLESAGLSVGSTYVFKYLVRRERPNQSDDPNGWEKGGGDSFPSAHSAAAFAIGTVLAESGNDEYRWIRRILGYGLGAGTSYERLKHNAHWLSDTVAGSALGIATAHFVMNRHNTGSATQAWSVVPVQGGAMLTYNRTMD